MVLYFENHPGTHLYKHSKPFMIDTTPQKGYNVVGQMKETCMSVKHELAQFHATLQQML
jgi:hypothetical protein